MLLGGGSPAFLISLFHASSVFVITILTMSSCKTTKQQQWRQQWWQQQQ
jgi:hypothetical protein